MLTNSQKVINWRNRTKQRIVDSFGNKCGICGYNKCNSAFDLHHLDPEKKEFSLGSIRANPKKWKKIIIELRKCVLLCANCHREFHEGITKIPYNIKKFDETFSDYVTLQKLDRHDKLYDPCLICRKEKLKTQKTCSYECAGKLRGKFKWENFDLKKLYLDDKLSLNKISILVGCSSSAVRKRLKKIKIYIKQ